jgi:exopolysaccharide biosynthesis polyprenyl glycosylphosphotransferase
LLFSYALRFHTKMKFFGMEDPRITLATYSGQLVLGLCVMMVLLVHFRTYNPHRLGSFIHAASGIAKASFTWLVGFMAISLMLRFEPGISRLYCGIAAVEVMIGLLTWRLFFCRYLRHPERARRLQERVLLVGWTEDCAKIVHLLHSGARHPYQIIGTVPPPDGFQQGVTPGVTPLGRYDDLREILTREQVDVVLVADLTIGRDELTILSNLCEIELVDYKILPSAFQILLSGLHLESFNGVPVLGVSRLPLHSAFNRFLKRLVDIIGSVVGLIFGMPLVMIFGYLVKRESPGPIFYKQVRTGRNGKSFTIYKIRSMRLDAEADGKAGWSTEHDPRRLAIGSTIRKWNVDEIPQFWNVLLGQMSLVGPRPERPELIHNFREVIPHYNARHNIKPGITGWAQVNGFRGNTDLTERINCDLFYIENWNLLLDFQIMFMTFFKRDNAY